MPSILPRAWSWHCCVSSISKAFTLLKNMPRNKSFTNKYLQNFHSVEMLIWLCKLRLRVKSYNKRNICVTTWWCTWGWVLCNKSLSTAWRTSLMYSFIICKHETITSNIMSHEQHIERTILIIFIVSCTTRAWLNVPTHKTFSINCQTIHKHRTRVYSNKLLLQITYIKNRLHMQSMILADAMIASSLSKLDWMLRK